MIYNATYTMFSPYILFWGLVVGILMLSHAIHIWLKNRLQEP